MARSEGSVPNSGFSTMSVTSWRRPLLPLVTPTAERLFLLDVGDVDQVAQLVDLAQDVEQVALAALLEVVLELQGAVEVVDDRALAAAGDHDHLLDAAGDRLLDAVLNGRLVDQRQHLFGLGLGGRQEARAETRGGKDRLADRRRPRPNRHWHPI